MNGNPGKLNVILHGLVMFFQRQNEITAYLPNMGPEHAYRAGTWLAETAIDEHADITLRVPKNGHTGDIFRFDPNPDKNVFLKGVRPCTCGCEDHTIYATFHLPYPDEEIRSLAPLKIPMDALEGQDKEGLEDAVGDAKGEVKEVSSASVQVLTYHFATDRDLCLDNHPWEPLVVRENGTNYVNLHIFAEPELSVNEDHVVHAFQAATAIFAGVDLRLKKPLKPGPMDIPDPQIAGILKLELEDLVHRRRRLDVLGRAIRESRDLNSIWNDPVPFVDGDPNTCTGTCIGESRNA